MSQVDKLLYGCMEWSRGLLGGDMRNECVGRIRRSAYKIRAAKYIDAMRTPYPLSWKSKKKDGKGKKREKKKAKIC